MKQLIIIALLLLTASVGCQSPSSAPVTVEGFSDAFRAAYDSGDKDSISALVDWTNVDSEVRELQLGLLTTFLGDNRITDISTSPFDPDTLNNPINNREVELNIAPTHMFSAQHAGNAGFEGGHSSGAVTMPIGQKDGRYYFCGWAYKESP